MNDIFNWLDKVLSIDYVPDETDYEILCYLRYVQRLIKEGSDENKRKR